MKRYIMIGLLAVFVSCKTETQQNVALPDAKHLLDVAVEKAGGDLFYNAEITFRHQGIAYKSHRSDAVFSLQRFLPDTLRTVDILSNSGMVRLQKSEQVPLDSTNTKNYAAAIEKIHFLATAPFGYLKKADSLTYLGEVVLADKSYHKIFQQRENGEALVYWIATETLEMHYLAHRFHTDRMQLRFLEVIQPNTIEGIRFKNYRVYRPKDPKTALTDLDQAFEAAAMHRLSDVVFQNIAVTVFEN
jgi:hypothetical protein